MQIKDSQTWLYGSAFAWIVGFALMLAANNGIVFSNKLYKCTSPGVILAGEPDNIFEKYRDITTLRMVAKTITVEEMAKQQEEFQVNRARPLTVEWPFSRGTVYAERVDNGHRIFELVHTEHVQSPGNRNLQFLGAIIFACGFVGLFLEWRLRRLKNKLR